MFSLQWKQLINPRTGSVARSCLAHDTAHAPFDILCVPIGHEYTKLMEHEYSVHPIAHEYTQSPPLSWHKHALNNITCSYIYVLLEL